MPREINTGPSLGLPDLRAVVVAAVVGLAVIAPTFALRWGAVVCGLFAVGAFLSQRRVDRLDCLAILLGLFSLTSRAWSIEPEITALSSLNLIGAVAVFLGVRASIATTRHALLISYGFTAGCSWAAIQLLLAAGEVRFLFDISATRYALDVKSGASQNYLAYSFVACIAVLVFIWTLRRPFLIGRVTWWTVAGLMWLGIVQTGTRGALIGLILIVMWLAGRKVVPKRTPALLAVGIIGLNASILTGLGDDRLSGLAGSRARDTGTLNGRLDVWPLARQVMLEHPVLGRGAGTFRSLNPLDTAAHNALLDFGSGLGIAAVVLFTVILYLIFTPAWRAGGDRSQQVLMAGTMAAALTPALTTGYWIEAPVLWAALALTRNVSACTGYSLKSATTHRPSWMRT